MNGAPRTFPKRIYRRPLTSRFYTFDGEPIAFDSDDELRKNYRYFASTFSGIGEWEVWVKIERETTQ